MKKKEMFLMQYNKINQKDSDIRHQLNKLKDDIEKKNQKKSDLEKNFRTKFLK